MFSLYINLVKHQELSGIRMFREQPTECLFGHPRMFGVWLIMLILNDPFNPIESY